MSKYAIKHKQTKLSILIYLYLFLLSKPVHNYLPINE